MQARPRVVYDIVRDVAQWKTWDDDVVSSDVLETHDSGITFVYLALKPFSPLDDRETETEKRATANFGRKYIGRGKVFTGRDFYLMCQHSESTTSSLFTVVMKSHTPPRGTKDDIQKKGLVRGNVRASGFVIKPLEREDGTVSETESQVAYILQVDMTEKRGKSRTGPEGISKGLPSFVTEIMAKKKPMCLKRLAELSSQRDAILT